MENSAGTDRAIRKRHGGVSLELRHIPASLTVPLRHAVLWPDLPQNKQLMPVDSAPTTRHFGAFLLAADNGIGGSDGHDAYLPERGEDQLPIGVMTISLESVSPQVQLPEHIRAGNRPLEVQLHKFAVLPGLQGRGIGGRMLRDVCERLLTIDMTAASSTEENVGGGVRSGSFGPVLLHLDARESQKDVYLHMGFSVLSDAIFHKRGPTGTGAPIGYIKMGRLLEEKGSETWA